MKWLATAHTHSTMNIDSETQTILLETAKESISNGLKHHRPPKEIDTSKYSALLTQPGASFVTLKLNGELRGCIGCLEAYRPLIDDVSRNAYSAAFSDPRFLPLTDDEFPNLEMHISVLNPAEEISFESESDLIRQLRPGIDGLILSEGSLKGTFLPSVWEQLPNPEAFLKQLKRKAGLPADYWSDSIRVSRYTTTSFPD